ncbi:hypothetical protein SPI_08388 [Niveomyces insectorum RCEF 264]|uniref:Integral membrane protein n=1 Tax=Niveomyces insectorum RCEF 264 TaxID=1081102 RepID=A0A167N9K4_9HYPO|nr:hypothetical protein SPI_08388 [Niveomyces insectorum RCEF 264]
MSGYFFGSAFTGIGILSVLAPEKDYEVFGLPLEPPAGNVSPMIYAKGARDLSYGLAYFFFQYKGMHDAINVFSAALLVTALSDGLIVWRYGGNKLKSKAYGHWGGLVAFSAWLAWRVYGE